MNEQEHFSRFANEYELYFNIFRDHNRSWTIRAALLSSENYQIVVARIFWSIGPSEKGSQGKFHFQ